MWECLPTCMFVHYPYAWKPERVSQTVVSWKCPEVTCSCREQNPGARKHSATSLLPIYTPSSTHGCLKQAPRPHCMNAGPCYVARRPEWLKTLGFY